MPPLTKNLGLVKAIEVGTIPPTNVQMLWYDINLGQNLHKYYDLLTSSWVPLNLNSRSIIVDILYLDLLDLKNNNNLSENTTYRILDRADLGVIIKAISSNLLSVDGEGVFLNCDCQNVFGNNLGQWYSTLSGIVIGNVVRYLGIQYSSITGNVGTSPDGDIVNWFPIPKSTTTYILEVDIIKYDFNNDNIIYRADKRGNEVYKNISRFQWGNDNIKNNKDYSGSFTNINSRGSFDSIINKAFYEILIDETNTVNISYTEFGELPYITFTNCSGYINSCTINTQDSLTITGAVSYEKCIIYNNIGSSFSNTLDMSDVAIFSGNVITIPITLRFIGSFILLNNTGQVINKIIGMPKHNKVKFYVENGNTQQFQLTLIGSAIDYNLVGDDSSLITITGRSDASDYIEFETSDKLNVVTRINNKDSIGSTFTNSNPTTITVGGYNIGSTFSTPQTMQQMWNNLLYPFIPPAFTSFNINAQSILIEVGTSLSGVKLFQWSTSQSANIQSNSIAIRDVTANSLLASSLTNDGSENVNIGTISNLSPITQSWRIEGINTQLSPFNSSNYSISSIYPIFYGKVASGGALPGINRPIADQTLINSGTKSIISSTGTININFNTTSDDYMWFAIPNSSTSKIKWFIDSLNNGNIGGAVSPGGNLFPIFDLVSIDSPIALWSGVNYKIYIANYQSSVIVQMELRNS